MDIQPANHRDIADILNNFHPNQNAMKYASLLLIAFLFSAAACTRSSHDHPHSHDAGDSTNEALNEKVLEIHDEVMAKGDDLYRLKTKLRDSLANSKNLSAETKASLESIILTLDSASKAMNKWMHEFDPNKDSADQEKSREYFETEIEKITKIKALTEEAIDRAKK